MCIKCDNATTRKNYIDNRAARLEQKKEYYIRNKDAIAKRKAEYSRRTRLKINARQSAYNRRKLHSDPIYKLKDSLRNHVKRIAKGGKQASSIIGCTWEEAKAHIERQFSAGMSWDNHGLMWELDHVIPLSYATTPEEAIKLSHYTNIRPLLKLDNRRKWRNIECLTSEGLYYISMHKTNSKELTWHY
jgi:hypothetical protein